MPGETRKRVVGLVLSGILLCSCADSGKPVAEVTDAWTPTPPPGSSVAAVYATITVDNPDVLVAAASPVADEVGMHATIEENGVMQMRPIEQLPLNPGEPLRFEPGGMHIMLSGIRQVLSAGTHFPLTLTFAASGEVEVTVKVVAPGATP